MKVSSAKHTAVYVVLSPCPIPYFSVLHVETLKDLGVVMVIIF